VDAKRQLIFNIIFQMKKTYNDLQNFYGAAVSYAEQNDNALSDAIKQMIGDPTKKDEKEKVIPGELTPHMKTLIEKRNSTSPAKIAELLKTEFEFNALKVKEPKGLTAIQKTLFIGFVL
jgi:hypothetical protein